MCRELIESLIADYVKDAKEFLMADPVLREVSLGTMRKQKTAEEIAQQDARAAPLPPGASRLGELPNPLEAVEGAKEALAELPTQAGSAAAKAKALLPF